MTELVQVRTAGGTIVAPAGLLQPVHRYALLAETYERDEIFLSEVVLENGPGNVVELGSGLGMVARRVGASATHVTAVEANPVLIPSIRRNLEAFDHVDILHVAAVPDGTEARGWVLGADESFLSKGVTSQATAGSVPTRSIDELVGDGCDLLVMDVEGMERELVASPALNRVHAVVLELHPEVIGIDGCRAVMAALEEHGLRPDPVAAGGHCATFVRGRQQADPRWSLNVLRGAVAVGKGEFIEAAELFERAIKDAPGADLLHIHLLEALVRGRRLDDAASLLDRWDPPPRLEVFALRAAVDAGLMGSECAAVEENLLRLQALRPGNPLDSIRWARYRHQKKDHVLAVEAAQSVVSLVPELPQAHFVLGQVLMGAREQGRALASFVEAVRLAPDNEAYRTRLEWVRERFG
ncbi:FkbM family methyltransferase [Euzebya rosea]|uniref:FkbM family methyltransferase n=1 Tax=Euzebya rosea TaxID=2052804 RepID=UPI000D3E8A74|nr:FkbM family methyltransferase [Euzebya rosea]